ncbi:MAG: hypothetical protein N7Q72_06655, partial [Spiroplasma sp. Tabriz.8]|nr:hypothetical protein [Spiroplasma sp. Tabriz.8]
VCNQKVGDSNSVPLSTTRKEQVVHQNYIKNNNNNNKLIKIIVYLFGTEKVQKYVSVQVPTCDTKSTPNA